MSAMVYLLFYLHSESYFQSSINNFSKASSRWAIFATFRQNLAILITKFFCITFLEPFEVNCKYSKVIWKN